MVNEPPLDDALLVQAVVTGVPEAMKGEKGNRGAPGEPGLPNRTRRALFFLFTLAVILGATGLFYGVHQSKVNQQARARQARIVEQKLCTTLGKLAALKPPASDPAHPSRMFDQELHAALAQLGPDIGCGPR